MTISELIRLPSRLAWLATVVVLLAVVVFVMGQCSRGDAIRAAKDDAGMADARTASAIEAITEIGRLEERGQATETQVEEAENAIRQADPADRDRVARAHLCRLQSRPDCDGVL